LAATGEEHQPGINGAIMERTSLTSSTTNTINVSSVDEYAAKVTKVIQFVGLLVLGFFWLHGVVLSVLGMVLLVFAMTLLRCRPAVERNHCWASRPGRELVISTVVSVIVFVLLGVYGVIMPALTVDQVLLILAFSAVSTLGVEFPKYHAFRAFGL